MKKLKRTHLAKPECRWEYNIKKHAKPIWYYLIIMYSVTKILYSQYQFSRMPLLYGFV